METSLSDGTGKALHDSVDFARRHETLLITAGVVVIGATAVVKTGGVGKLLELFRPAEPAAADALLPKIATELAGTTVGGQKAAFLKGVDNYLFDMDRTLIPTGDGYAAMHGELTRQLVKHTGLPADFVSDVLRQTSEKIDSNVFADRLDLLEPIQQLYPGVNLNERFPEIAPAAKNAYYAALKPRQDVIDLLDSLTAQGKQLHVFTAASPSSAVERLDASGLSKYFKTIFTAAKHPVEDGPGRSLLTESTTGSKVVELMESPKDNESGYREILDRLKIDPKKTLMTGDTNAQDIASAKGAGMYTAQAHWIRQDVGGYAIPDLTLESPGQLQRLVELNK